MRRALEELVVDGIRTTAPLHKRIMDDPEFQAGDYTIHWLERFVARSAAAEVRQGRAGSLPLFALGWRHEPPRRRHHTRVAAARLSRRAVPDGGKPRHRPHLLARSGLARHPAAGCLPPAAAAVPYPAHHAHARHGRSRLRRRDRRLREPAPGREDTWINPEIEALFTALHRLGHHSLEVWLGEELVGGLYGVRIGAAFFGESMFSRVTDASQDRAGASLAQAATRAVPLAGYAVPHRPSRPLRRGRDPACGSSPPPGGGDRGPGQSGCLDPDPTALAARDRRLAPQRGCRRRGRGLTASAAPAQGALHWRRGGGRPPVEGRPAAGSGAAAGELAGIVSTAPAPLRCLFRRRRSGALQPLRALADRSACCRHRSAAGEDAHVVHRVFQHVHRRRGGEHPAAEGGRCVGAGALRRAPRSRRRRPAPRRAGGRGRRAR